MIMYHQLHLSQLFLVLMMTIGLTQATVRESFFKKVGEGQSIIKKLGAELKARSKLECAVRCLNDNQCRANKYRRNKARNCLLLYKNFTEEEGQIMEQDSNSAIFEKDVNECAEELCQNGGTCIDGINEYSCSCIIGYTGSNCETNINECAEEPYKNGGTCMDEIKEYICTCISVYTGYNCETEETTVSGDTFILPDGWTGADAALYFSFDSSDGFVLMEGPQEIGSVPIVTGQMNNAWSLDCTKRQWVDLGIHTEACMTIPETCGAAGGAISLWVKVIDCDNGFAGIVSSHAAKFSGSVLDCWNGENIHFHVIERDGFFNSHIQIQLSDWIHIVLNYIGPNDGQGYRMLMNAGEVTSGTTKHAEPWSAGDGRIVVGRYLTDIERFYATSQVDELIFFNQSLTQQEINVLAAVT